MAGDGTEILIDEKGKRTDGRNIDQMRPISIKVGIIKNADGSAEIRMGNNIIIAAVYGPRELHPKHRALPDRALIQCFYRMSTFSVGDRKSPAPSRREREISSIIANALNSVAFVEAYPRTTIDVYLQVLQADGGTRCAGLTAASIALADAGIPMKGLIAGVASGLINDTAVLDLNNIEDQKGSGDVPVGYSPTLDEISLLQLDGVFTIEQFEKTLKLSLKGCTDIYQIQKEALKAKYIKIRDETSVEVENMASKTVIEEDIKEQDTKMAESIIKEDKEKKVEEPPIKAPKPVIEVSTKEKAPEESKKEKAPEESKKEKAPEESKKNPIEEPSKDKEGEDKTEVA
ncbi:Ribonuclease PH [subsurface metagenome]